MTSAQSVRSGQADEFISATSASKIGPLEPAHSIIVDSSDLLFYAALMLLPVDGTVAGVALPYWTPLSPWFFLAYALVNFRRLRVCIHRYLPVVLLPILLLVISVYGWTTVGFHGVAALKSFGSVILGVACLASLEIAVKSKRLPCKPMVTVLVAAYALAFLVGVVQWSGRYWQVEGIKQFFAHLMYRDYAWQRPQFLFAEPSYIGMHLFGVLLPVYWLTHDSRLAVLIPVFALGSVGMGAGTRIIVDTVVAGLLWLMASVNFKRRGGTLGAAAAIALIAASGVAAVVVDPRLNKLASDGLLRGDASVSSRIFHMLAPAWAWKQDMWHTLFGWGAGNIAMAEKAGYQGAIHWYESSGGLINPEISGLANPPADTFTMSGYTSFITEFGLVMALLVVALIIVGVAVHRAWSRRMVCWLVLVAYLYVQFEAYAFYALPLLVWGIWNQGSRLSKV